MGKMLKLQQRCAFRLKKTFLNYFDVFFDKF